MLKLLHGVLVLIGTLTGVLVAYNLDPEILSWVNESTGYPPKVLMGILFGGMGYLTAATLHVELTGWLERRLPTLSIFDIVWGTTGLVLGLLVANLFCMPFLLFLNSDSLESLLKGRGWISSATLLVPLTANVVLGYLGIFLVTRRQGDLRNHLLPWAASQRLGGRTKVLDTSAVIDGRIVALLECGAVEGPVDVPRFVLHELQCVADSSEPIKRERGRRGFDNLEQLKQTPGISLSFPAADMERIPQVDAKLVEYCRQTGATLVTVDYNLNKLAVLQEVSSVNINEAADALRPSVRMGDKLPVLVTKRGKDAGQGVGYLEDGTMVVVDDGASRVGETVEATVHKMLRTSAGRMIFARIADSNASSDRTESTLKMVGGNHTRNAG